MSFPVAEEEGTTTLTEVTTDVPTVGSDQLTVDNNRLSVSTNKPIEIIVHRSFYAQIALSCFATWCCCVFGVFGLVAFILAIVAHYKEKSGKYQVAEMLANISTVISTVGFIVGFVFIIIVLVIRAKYLE